MSDGKSKLTLLLELKNKLFNNKLAETQKKFKRVTGKMKGNIDKLKAKHVKAFSAMRAEIPIFGRAMDLLGNPYVLIAAGAIALGVIFAKGFNEAKKFNHEFLQVKNLNLDKSKEQLSSYKNLIRDTAFSAGQDLSQTTKGFYDIQSALGVYGKDAGKIFTQVSKFSLATGADLNDSINASVKAMKAFNLTSGDLTMMLESNAKTVQVGITTFKELAQVQTEYAGAAMGAGQNLNTANKIFAAFTSIAKDSRTAATMTKTAFMGLTQKSTIEGIVGIGVKMYDANDKMRNMGDILKDVSAKFKTMSPRAIDALINKIGGPEGLRNLFVKLKTGAGDFFKTMETFDSSKFDLDAALKNAKGDFTVLSGIVKNRFNVIMSKLGEKVLPVVARIFERLNKTLQWAYKNWSALSKAVKFGVAVIGGLLIIRKVILLYKAWKTAQIALNAVFLASPIGIIAVGILAAVAAYKIFSRRVSDVSVKQKMLNGITSEANRMVASHKAKLERLLIVARDIKKPLDDRKKAMKAINEISPKFLGDIKLEEINTIKATTAIKSYIKELDRKSRMRAAVNKIDMLHVQMLDVEYNKQQRLKEIKAVYDKYGERLGNKQKDILAGSLLSYNKKIKIIEDQKKAIYDYINKNQGSLLGDEDSDFNYNGGDEDSDFNYNGGDASQDITEVTNQAAQARSVIINIDALNKGGINTQNTTLQHKSPEEIEEWYNEMMMRIIRNIEMGY